MSVTEEILRMNRLSVTPGRRKILHLFLNAKNALVHAEIEKECNSIIDRISIYRTLQIFLKKNIIHSIPTADDSIKYALSKVNPRTKQTSVSHSHAHFVCNNCKKTICLDMINKPEIRLPAGFKMRDCEVLIKGICSDCK
ncbi:MAG TPA: transcriptional repressor [Panacibacter sp.]|nr:transcriptional repressor [Panacibacter sp.]